MKLHAGTLAKQVKARKVLMFYGKEEAANHIYMASIMLPKRFDKLLY